MAQGNGGRTNPIKTSRQAGAPRWDCLGSRVAAHWGLARESRRCCRSLCPRRPEGDRRLLWLQSLPFPSVLRTDLARPGWALGARAARGGAPDAAPALGRAGAQGAGALLALRRGRWRRASGPPGAAVAPPGRARRARRRPPVPLEHGLPVWRGERLRRWRRP